MSTTAYSEQEICKSLQECREFHLSSLTTTLFLWFLDSLSKHTKFNRILPLLLLLFLAIKQSFVYKLSWDSQRVTFAKFAVEPDSVLCELMKIFNILLNSSMSLSECFTTVILVIWPNMWWLLYSCQEEFIGINSWRSFWNLNAIGPGINHYFFISRIGHLFLPAISYTCVSWKKLLTKTAKLLRDITTITVWGDSSKFFF